MEVLPFFPPVCSVRKSKLKTEQNSFKLFSCSSLYSFTMACSFEQDSDRSSATRSCDRIEYSFKTGYGL